MLLRQWAHGYIVIWPKTVVTRETLIEESAPVKTLEATVEKIMAMSKPAF